MKRQMTSLLLAVVMLVALLPAGPALATAATRVMVGSTPLDNGQYTCDGINKFESAPGDSVTNYAYFHEDSNHDLILTLKNFNPADDCYIAASGDLTIELIGESSITAPTGHYAINITAIGSLTIKNADGQTGGSLTATGGTGSLSAGIAAFGGLTVQSASVTSIGQDNDYGSYGVYANSITVEGGGSLTGKAGAVVNRVNSCGVSANGPITVKGGSSLTGEGSTAGDRYSDSYGVWVSNSITVEDGSTINGKAGEAGNASYGVYAAYSGSITASGTSCKITGTAATASNISVGVSAKTGSVTASGTNCRITGTGGTASFESYGVLASNSVIASGTNCSVVGTGGMADGDSTGVHAGSTITASGHGSVVTGTGGTAALESYGVAASSSVTVSGQGSAITGTGGTASFESYGVLASNSVIASGTNCSVVGTGGEATFKSYGVTANKGDITASGQGSVVTGTGGMVTGNRSRSYGVFAKDEINISGGTLNGTGGRAAQKSVGVAGSLTTLNNCFATAQATAGDGNSWAFANFDDDNDMQPATPAFGTDPWYAWATSIGGPYTQSATQQYTAANNHTYVSICPKDDIPSPLPTSSSGGPTAYVGSWQDGKLVIHADCSKFVGAFVDGMAIVRDRAFTVRCGSTIVELTPAFLATLPSGTHTLRVQFTDGYHESSFTAPLGGESFVSVDLPKTGDAPMTCLAALALAAAGLLILKKRHA